MTNGGFNGFAAPPAASLPPLVGKLVSGYYYFPTSQTNSSTSSTLTNGTLRLTPWWVPSPVSLSRIGGEVTSGGDSGCKLRLGIYADNGSGYPGTLLLDAGTIAGDSATVQDVTVSLFLAPGLYWLGGAVQLVSVTQPTVRTCSTTLGLVPTMQVGTATPLANTLVGGYAQTSVTGALPAAFTSTVSWTGTFPRLHVKVA